MCLKNEKKNVLDMRYANVIKVANINLLNL